MRNYFVILSFIIVFLIFISYPIIHINSSIFATPTDSIITNNNHINHQQSLQDLTQEINEDSLNYTFKKDEILDSLNSFKIDFINTINEYISSNNYNAANQYFNTYIHLFEDDLQLQTLQKILSLESSKNNLVEYTGDIEVLSFKPLIAYPESVFNNKKSSSIKLDEQHITTDEFERILLNLYNKNYILISPSSLISNNTSTGKQQLFIPKNKKPLILILEDVAYNSKTSGSVDKLLIDRNNQLSTYTPKRAINDRIHSNNDFITILENFVITHPSFSLNEAKAIIVVDGSQGIFGYHTQKTNATSKYEIKKAIEIINYLKNNGYSFASSGYNTDITDPIVSFASGLNSWENNITPIIGDSHIFFSDTNIKNLNNQHTEHFKILNNFNYSLFIGLDMESRFEYNTLLNSLYLTAKPISGKTLRYSQHSLSHLFDCEKIYDHINRCIPYNT